MTQDDRPHFMRENDDCMGMTTPAHWRQFLTCSDGRCVIGLGATAEEATKDANEERNKVEKRLSLPDEKQLQLLIDQDGMLSSDMERAIRLIAKIILRK